VERERRDGQRRGPDAPGGVALALALLAGGVALGLRLATLGTITHGPDAAAYRYQARLFAAGRWSAPATAFDREFSVQGLIVQHDGDRFAKYPPGWPLALAGFVRAGVPALADPVLVAALVLLVCWLARLLWPGDRRAAPVAGALGVVSPFVVFMGGSGLSHLPCAVELAAAAALVLRGLDARRTGGALAWGAGAGLAWGLAFLTRPFSAVLGAAAIAAVAVTGRPLRGTRVMATASGAVAGGSAGVAALLVYNHLTTGSVWKLGYVLYSARFDLFGGHAGASFAASHVVPHLRLALATLDAGTWGGLLPDLWLAVVALVLGARDARVWGLALATAIHVAGYAPYYFFDLYFGPRNLFEAMPWLLLLTARGVLALIDAARARRAGVLAAALLAAHFAWGLAVTFPRLARYYAADYWGDAPALVDRVRQGVTPPALVLVRSPFYMSLHDLNAAVPADGPLVVARVTTPERTRRLVEAFPGRALWRLDFAVRNRSDAYYARWKDVVRLTPPVDVGDVALVPIPPGRLDAALAPP
jgi:hypothetical protein